MLLAYCKCCFCRTSLFCSSFLPIQVYAQVTVLFQEAPDLLEEFKEFLPDHTGSTGLSGAQSSAIDQASASNAAASAQSATQSRTGRNTSTTSLFGVNASSTSQPQLGGVPSYLHNAQQRDRSKIGQVIGGTSLDVAASRRQVGPEHPSTSQLPAPPALVQEKATHDDDEWQAPGSARKRKPTAPAVPVVEKMKVST
jgi:histone deacetylase complex regulatory component SIN3